MRFRQGEAEAAAQFLVHARSLVQTVARRRLAGGWTEFWLDDTVQDILCDILRGLDRCAAENEKETRAWVRRIATTRTSALIRRERPRRDFTVRIETEDVIPSPAPSAPSPHIQALLQRLEGAATGLTGEQHALLWARHLAGLSWQEIGEEFGVAPTAVKRRHQRLLVRLRALIKA